MIRGDGGEMSAAALLSFASQQVFTVATLPTSPVRTQRAWVTDSNATWTAGIGAIVAGGGANVVPVGYDGTNWRIG